MFLNKYQLQDLIKTDRTRAIALIVKQTGLALSETEILAELNQDSSLKKLPADKFNNKVLRIILDNGI
jgi:hypothetical protein